MRRALVHLCLGNNRLTRSSSPPSPTTQSYANRDFPVYCEWPRTGGDSCAHFVSAICRLDFKGPFGAIVSRFARYLHFSKIVPVSSTMQMLVSRIPWARHSSMKSVSGRNKWDLARLPVLRPTRAAGSGDRSSVRGVRLPSPHWDPQTARSS
jgi:hypothetical protein